MALEYVQYLSDDLKNLYFYDKRYSQLRQLIQCDDQLVFAVRKDEIHIYYRGGRILKVTETRKCLKLECCSLNYARKQRGKDELNAFGDVIKNLLADKYNADLWVKNIDGLKECMSYYRENICKNPERQLQQDIELNNRNFNDEVVIVDNEYGVCDYHSKDRLCKVDLVALYKDNGVYKICLIELKRGYDAIHGSAGIATHVNDFDVIINKRKPDIIASINNLISYKKLNNYLQNVPDDIVINENTEICASILCYDLSDNQRTGALSLIKNSRENISFELHYNLKLDSNCHKLSKRDILGE
jgi:hypothetical protein